MLNRTWMLAVIVAGLAAGGCSTIGDYGSVRKESLRNDQGHVIGYKEMLRNSETGEVIAKVSMFKPMLGANGELIGYEEQARGGAIIRDLDGRNIGGKFSDLRSRRSLTIVFRPADAAKVAEVTQPKIGDLLASLSASDLRRVQ